MNKEFNKSPAFQFYPDKWQSHTRRLSDSAYRIYFEMLCWMWQHSEDHCSISNNAEAIACILAMPCERIAQALREIQNPHAPLLKLDGDLLVSNGLRKEATKQRKRREKLSDIAKQRWDKEKQQMHTHSTSNANARFMQCLPSPSPIPSPSPATHVSDMGKSQPTPTLKECFEIGNIIAMKPKDVEAFHAHYDSQGWTKGNGQRITNIRSAMQAWKIKDQKLVEEGKKYKTRLDQ